MPSGHHDSQGPSYNSEAWMGLGGGYTQPGAQHGSHGANEYHNYEYSSTPMTMEPSYTMSRPPPYAPATHSQMPPPLVMPQHNVWPSMLTNSSSYNTPILPAAPIQTPLSAISTSSEMTPTSAKTTTSRRKLTDDERRLMCLEAENNPTMKQTQIGAKFNVERSTVSKILRQKDKYMKPQPKEEVTSPGKRPKVKLPDVEKTLVNWARNQQRKGIAITNEELRKQILMFSAGRSDQATLSSVAWIERFKNKYLSGGESAHIKGEETTESSTTHSETLDNSPHSTDGLVSPPMSAIGDGQDARQDDIFNFDDSPSLHHGFSPDLGNSSEAVMSPLSPDLAKEHVGNSVHADPQFVDNFPRQRSQTLPHLVAEPSQRTISPARNVPALPVRSMTNIAETRTSSVDPRQTMKRHKSVPDIHDTEVVRFSTMQPPPIPRSADYSPVSVPGSPQPQDETIRALHHIKKMLEQRPDVAEPDDYVMIGKLMEKLRLLRSPTNTPIIMPGGMHPMELVDSPRLSKKRTMFEMSM